MFEKKQKILVEIIGGPFPKKKKCLVDENRVILRPAKEGRGGAAITADFDNGCLVPYYTGLWPLRSIKHKLVLKEGASKCVNFIDKDDTNAPTCTKSDVSKFGQATVIKLSGSLKPPFNVNIIYVLLVVGLILTGISILVGTGRLRF